MKAIRYKRLSQLLERHKHEGDIYVNIELKSEEDFITSKEGKGKTVKAHTDYTIITVSHYSDSLGINSWKVKTPMGTYPISELDTPENSKARKDEYQNHLSKMFLITKLLERKGFKVIEGEISSASAPQVSDPCGIFEPSILEDERVLLMEEQTRNQEAEKVMADAVSQAVETLED